LPRQKSWEIRRNKAIRCGHLAQLISQLSLKPGEEEIKKKSWNASRIHPGA
jgi:hypothetical protein